MNSSAPDHGLEERLHAFDALPPGHESMFRRLFEHSADAMFLSDPRREVFVDCNQAAVEMMRASCKQQLLLMNPADLSPEFQPDGRSSRERVHEDTALALSLGRHRFEWHARRMDGTEFPVEVLLTPIQTGDHPLIAAVCRDITERKRSERELRELTQTLERRVNERTAELSASEARFRALVEHAPEAIVVYSVDTGRFLFGNQHACDLYGVSMSKLAELTPAEVSPEFQPGGRRTSDLVREKISEVLAGGIAVFDWLHKHVSGRLIDTEVRLLRLPAEGQTLIRASIIDNTGRKRAERALRESEAKFRALFEGASQGVVLHDENEILEVNPAAVRILGRRFAHEMLGKHPGDFSPPFQPNGESSDTMARKCIDECMTKGSARFDWLACSPNGREIPLEVMLTRIEWSGRQVIQAFITDITERTRAQAALAESEARFSVAFQASPFFIGILQMSDGAYVLANDAFVNWLGIPREEIIGRSSAEFGMWENAEERASALNDMRTIGSIRQREVRWRNCHGECLTILLSAETIKLNDTPHILSFAQDITQRKRAEEELRASDERVRESEARFSAAFRASPVSMTISKLEDGCTVLANEAFLKWTGYRLDEVLGRNSVELALWADPADRESFWEELRGARFIHERECRVRNRHGKIFTMLLSADIIEVNRVPHLLTVGLDITERKQTEAKLRESEARFSAAFHASPAFISIVRMSDARYVLANDVFLNFLGCPLEDILGRTCSDIGLWEHSADRDLLLHDMQTLGSIRQRECRWLNRRGEPFTILLSIDTIHLNNTPHMLLMALDITQRKKAEVEMLKALTSEKELSQLKSNFVSMVSHEFRTPLGIIQSSAELLRDFHQKMPVAERDEQLGSIIRNTRRMAGMMEEVLVLSRLDAGKLDFQPATLDLSGFCHRVVDEVLSATNRRCRIELLLHALPPEAKADERLLGHIFTNLLSNAVKYSEPSMSVHFTVDRDGDDAVCVVYDHGIGISEDDQRQLFKAFHRGGNVGTRPGTGLGLLLVKRCAELHGGNVHLNSKINEGTTVTVRLPIFQTNHEKNIGH